MDLSLNLNVGFNTNSLLDLSPVSRILKLSGASALQFVELIKDLIGSVTEFIQNLETGTVEGAMALLTTVNSLASSFNDISFDLQRILIRVFDNGAVKNVLVTVTKTLTDLTHRLRLCLGGDLSALKSFVVQFVVSIGATVSQLLPLVLDVTHNSYTHDITQAIFNILSAVLQISVRRKLTASTTDQRAKYVKNLHQSLVQTVKSIHSENDYIVKDVIFFYIRTLDVLLKVVGQLDEASDNYDGVIRVCLLQTSLQVRQTVTLASKTLRLTSDLNTLLSSLIGTVISLLKVKLKLEEVLLKVGVDNIKLNNLFQDVSCQLNGVTVSLNFGLTQVSSNQTSGLLQVL